MGYAGLIGIENVAGLCDQYEFGPWNTLGDQLRICGWDEPIGFAVDDERRGGDLRDAAVGLPAKNSLKLAGVTLGSGIPLHTDGHVLVDALSRGAGVVDERDDSFLGFFGRQVTAHENLECCGLGLYRMGTSRCGAS